MTTSLYRDIIKESWRTALRHKFLWFFGIFAALLGNGGEYEILFRNVDTIANQQAIITNLKNFSNTGSLAIFWKGLVNYFTNYTLGSVIFLIIILLICAFVIWLVIVSQAGLIDSALKLLSQEKANLESGFKAGRKYFLPVFLLNLIGKVIIYGLLIAIGVPLILLFLTKGTTLWNLVFILSSFVILVPLAIIVSFNIKYASAYVISKGEKIAFAFKDGWKLFTKNWLISIEMALLVLIINILFGFALIILAALLSIPFVLLGLIFYLIGAAAAFLVIVTIGIIALFILVFIVGGFISAFQWTAWMALFKRLTEGKATSKIVRIFSRVPNYLGKTS